MSDLISRSKLIHDLKEWLNVLECDMNKGEYSELCINQGTREAVKQIIQDVTEMPSANGWINCKECIPDEYQSVLVYIDNDVREAFYSDGAFIGSNFYRDLKDIKWWISLPEPPKE